MSSFNRGGGGRPGATQAPGRPYEERREQKIADCWPDYLKDGYFDAQDNLRLEYVARHIEGRDDIGVEPMIRAMANGHPKLTTAQLRRFFQHCRGIETRLKSQEATWSQVRPSFEFLAAAAADAYGKQPRKIPDLFYDFICRNIATVKTERDFLHGFLPHFEALVGFGSLHIQKERN